MKIAMITETFLPSTDGIVVTLTFAIDEILKQGHEIIIICPDVGGVKKTYKGAKIYPMKAINVFFYNQRKWGLPSKKVKKILQEFKPDIVHAINPISLASSGVKYAKKLGIPLICSYNTNVPDYFNLYGFGVFTNLAWKYIKRLHNSATINLTPSKAANDLLEKHGFKNLRVLPKAVDTRNRNPNFRSEEMKKRLSGGKLDKILLVYVGRLAPEKEVETLRGLFDLRNDICLAIVGDGPSRSELEKTFAGTNTLFTGFLKGKELSEAYASGDIFVFPSQSETLGLVITEAMASGLPVIATPSDPILEQITHGESGLIYDKNSMTELSKCINILQDKQTYEKIKQNGYNYAVQFSWEKSSQAIIQAYKDVLESIQ